MAPRKSTNKKSQADGPKAAVVFWLVFFIVIVSIALFNWPTITKNFELFRTRIANPPGSEEELLDNGNYPAQDGLPSQPPVAQEPIILEPEPRRTPQRELEQPSAPTAQTTQTPPQTQTAPAAPPSVGTPQASQQTQTSQQQQASQQASPPTAPPTAPPAAQTPPQTPSVQTRERTIYFAQITNDGQIIQSRVIRRIPVSETPMQDVLRAILEGPIAEELGRNIINLIPKGTRLISATVRGSTAYLNFSEDFMFNTYGVEGYVAQLRQIVWTVTEFPNVRDVQILIEGRRIDYLAEGIWIGSPIGRQ